MDRNHLSEFLRILTPRQEKVIRLYFGLGCKRSHQASEMAQEFGVSSATISGILDEATSRLAEVGVTARQLREAASGVWEAETMQATKTGHFNAIWPDEPLKQNPFPENTDRYQELESFFDLIKKAKDYGSVHQELSYKWRDRIREWRPFLVSNSRLPSRLVQSAACLVSLGPEVARVCLKSVEATAEVGLRICLNAIGDAWLKAEARAKILGADMEEFQREATDHGYCRYGSPIGVTERVWLRMQETGEPLAVVEREIPNQFGPFEQDAAGWLQDGIINHPYKAIAHFVAIRAAIRAAELNCKDESTPAPSILAAESEAVFPTLSQPAAQNSFEDGNRKENQTAVKWEDIEISFLSDFKIQISLPGRRYAQNYGEMGFGDRRANSGGPKPNQAWLALRVLAEHNGTIRDVTDAGTDWARAERRMMEIRKALKAHFGLAGDPLPLIEGTGYRARFKIATAPSYHT